MGPYRAESRRERPSAGPSGWLVHWAEGYWQPVDGLLVPRGLSTILEGNVIGKHETDRIIFSTPRASS
eukprot:5897145-Pyramimonas_sp.AAC.1